MALKLAFFIAMATVPALVGATDFIVGDNEGWKVGVNYTEWAEGKDFRVGDSIVFNYVKGKHNVLRVNGSIFHSCNNRTGNITPPQTTGNDKIELTTAGRKWYICDIKDHCEKGMKLFIDVNEAEVPSPSPTGGNGNSGNSADSIASFTYSYLVGLVAIWGMVIMF